MIAPARFFTLKHVYKSRIAHGGSGDEEGAHRARYGGSHHDVEGGEEPVSGVSTAFLAADSEQTQEREPPPPRLALSQVLRREGTA